MTNQPVDSQSLTSKAPNLLLLNAKVITMAQGQPIAQAVAVLGQKILAVGRNKELAALAGANTRTIDCQGMTLLPGFNDAHCHLLATAATFQGVDCGPQVATNILELQQALSHRANELLQGNWLKGFGYDDLSLAEGRHPNRWDLDRAAPNYPIRLDHRSGHATVLNSLGLAQAGINRDTPDPTEGVIQRDDATGEPTGLLLEMGGFLSERLKNIRSEDDQAEGVSRLNRRLLSYGITSTQDAGPQNNPSRLAAFGELQESGLIAPRITMMAGSTFLMEFSAEGMAFGSGNQRLRLGHLKIMLTLTTGQLYPDFKTLSGLIVAARKKGFPVAIHAIETEAVVAAARAIGEVTIAQADQTGEEAHSRSSRPRDRIEHCSECPPEVAVLVKSSGAIAVTQPGFIYWNGDNYLDRVDPALLPWLYPAGSLSNAGVGVAFGSDAPVIDPNPWPDIYSAVTGLTRSGQSLRGDRNNGPAHYQVVPLTSALSMYTLGAAYAEGTEEFKGSIEPGKLADLTLLDADVAGLDPSELMGVRAAKTIIEGRLVWES